MSELDVLTDSLPDTERAAVSAWLRNGETEGSTHPRALLNGFEPVGHGMRRPTTDDPSAIRTVGIVGGGTAGYLTALALRARRPWLEVSVIESPSIPIIGVGEATVPGIIPFLHHDLDIDIEDFYQRVQPTWKLGIRFEWGPDPDGFMAPFDWNRPSVGILGALKTQGSIGGFSFGSLLMMRDAVPVFDTGGGYVSLLKHMQFAYHLDNARLVGYLTELAGHRGVRHVDATIAEVAIGSQGWVDHLRTADGRELRYDLYVDCTGFRSRLLEQALGVPFISYAGSLFTDSAVTGNRAHGGRLKPYTTAATMEAGWCWTIPVPEEDHLGYVYSSAAISDDAAAAELARRYPDIGQPRYVRFRSGRHQQAWQGNVIAIGNSYAFVEPLESTGLLMITNEIKILTDCLPASWADPQPRAAVNELLGRRWDGLRSFLSLHYKFNSRFDTPFWRHARENTDISSAQPVLDLYASGAPLRYRGGEMGRLARGAVPLFYGLAGIDTILLGQRVPTRPLPMGESVEAWQARKAAAAALARHALPQDAALKAVTADPHLLHELLDDDDSWAKIRILAGR